MFPEKIYYEPTTLDYSLGKKLKEKYKDIKWIEIENHNNIPEMRQKENREFAVMKRSVILGIRKTHKYVANFKSSDFLVPWTSSGCSAMCLYCYLVCNYNKCAYLRLFANREQMLDKLTAFSRKSATPLTFEIGSNSDLILENTITDNLPWVIEEFARQGRGKLTFPTKFEMVDSLLGLDHKGKTIFRMSVNPEEIIGKIELGTSHLNNRIEAMNKMAEADYPVGLLIAPVIMIDDWKEKYKELLDTLEAKLSKRVKEKMFIEVIFMTYSYIHRAINNEAFPHAPELYSKEYMIGRGRGKYWYRQNIRDDGEEFLRVEITKHFPNNEIIYFC